jgi:hypothetical protein
VEYKYNIYTSNKWGNWNHILIMQKIPKQSIRNGRTEGTIENSHIEHYTCTLENNDGKVRVQSIQRGK